MATKLQIYNGALRRLGNPLLVTLAENLSSRRYLDSVWDEGFIDYVLDRGKWSFAKRTEKITYSTTLIPQFGFKRAFAQPLDFIKLVAIWLNPECTVPLYWYNYEAGVFYTQQDTIYLQYVSNDSAYGGNYAVWPSAFTQYTQAYMAQQAAPFITNQSGKDLEKELIIAERMALTSDGLNKPIQVQKIGSWNQARLYAYPYNGIVGVTGGGSSGQG